jgi:hypothetical protein
VCNPMHVVSIAVSREMIGKLYLMNISNKSQVTGQIIILTQGLLLNRTTFQQKIVDYALETINCFIDKKARCIVDSLNQFLIRRGNKWMTVRNAVCPSFVTSPGANVSL